MNTQLKAEQKGVEIVEEVFLNEFGGADHLRTNTDGAFWHYCGTHWHQLPTVVIQKLIMDRFIDAYPEHKHLSHKASESGLRFLKVRILAPEPIEEASDACIINCANCEVHVTGAGDLTAKTHCCHSYCSPSGLVAQD